MEYAHKLFSTRGGTLLLAGLTAVIAAIAVFAYVEHYRSSVKEGGVPATVLVSSGPIVKGTPGSVIATKHLYQAQTIRESQLREGAVSDPSSLRGMVAKTDILGGQQLTVADFTSAKGGLTAGLAGLQRATTISIDSAHGMIGQIADGDRVDVYAGFNVNPVDSSGRPIMAGQSRPVLRLIMQNVTVLHVTKSNRFGASSDDSEVTLKTTSYQSQKLAFASDNGKVWLVLRPPSGARPAAPRLITVETLLLGLSPTAVLHTFGGKS
ncbi:MAG: Flp pilus assembly protein CpaB [Verrucomicrobiota bacterium]